MTLYVIIGTFGTRCPIALGSSSAAVSFGKYEIDIEKFLFGNILLYYLYLETEVPYLSITYNVLTFATTYTIFGEPVG